jgi:hypothetical protein
MRPVAALLEPLKHRVLLNLYRHLQGVEESDLNALPRVAILDRAAYICFPVEEHEKARGLADLGDPYPS